MRYREILEAWNDKLTGKMSPIPMKSRKIWRDTDKMLKKYYSLSFLTNGTKNK